MLDLVESFSSPGTHRCPANGFGNALWPLLTLITCPGTYCTHTVRKRTLFAVLGERLEHLQPVDETKEQYHAWYSVAAILDLSTLS